MIRRLPATPRVPALGVAAAVIAALVAACASHAQPVPIDSSSDACHGCRMIVSDPRLAAEIVAPGEEPLIFDDIGCLRDYLRRTSVAPDRVIYVADHRTGDWILATQAVYARVPNMATPMGSHLVAYRDAASRDADRQANGAESVEAAMILGPHGMERQQ